MAQHNRVVVNAVATVATASVKLAKEVESDLKKAKASGKSKTLGELLDGRSKARSADESSKEDE